MYPEYVEGFGIVGIVKETAVRGLGEFIQRYFRNYPVYCDKTYAFYTALGDRKVGLSSLFNPLSLVGIICDALQRMKQKEITGNVTAGEGVVQGGIILFDSKGKPLAMYPEETGQDLRVSNIAEALQAIRDEVDTKGKEKEAESGAGEEQQTQ